MKLYRVRYQVVATVDYLIEAETPEAAYRQADQAPWDEGTLMVECIEGKEMLDEAGERIVLDWDAIHEAIDEGEER